MVLRGISKHGDAVHLCVKKAVINVLVPYLHARLINEFHEARTTNDLKADEKYAEEDAWVCARLNNAAFVATAGPFQLDLMFRWLSRWGGRGGGGGGLIMG